MPNHYCMLACGLLLLLQWAGRTEADNALALADRGRAVMTLVPAEDTEAVRFAAESLQTRLEQIIGAPVPVSPAGELPESGPVLVLGRYSAPLITRLAGALAPPATLAEWQREDHFTVRQMGERVLLAGGSDRAVLYAVYDFLKRECGCGFFVSGEHLPPQPDLRVVVTDRSRYPRLPVRAFFSNNGTVVHYSAWAWSPDDWRRHVDWYLAQGLRQAWLPYGTPGRERVWREYGFEYQGSSPEGAAIAAPTLERARAAGLDWIVSGWQGQVPSGFRERYPDHEYVEVKWVDFPSEWYLRPADPLFREITLKLLDNFAELYALQGRLGLVSSGIYAEKVYGRDQEERRELLTSFARVLPALVRERHQARLQLDTWAFHNRVFWTPELREAFFEAFPEDARPLLFDFSSNTRPFFQETEHFWGNEWVYGWYYTDAPSNFFAEYPQGRLEEIRSLYLQGRGLSGLVGTLEVIDYNELLPNLICAAAWDPELDFSAFLADFVRSRYGDHPVLLQAWQYLLASAYGPLGDRRVRSDDTAPYHLAAPRYHFRLGAAGTAWRTLQDPRYLPAMNQRLPVLTGLQAALRAALQARDDLSGHYFYQRDLVEWTRQLLVEIFNQSLLRAELAYLKGDAEGFRDFRSRTERCLELQVHLHESVSTWPEFSFSAQRTAALEAPLAGRPWPDVIAWLAGSRGGEINDRHTDYYRVDRLESVRDFYGPRLRAYLEVLAQRLAGGERELPAPDRPATQEVMDWTVFNYASPPGEGRLADLYRDLAYRFAYELEPQRCPPEQLHTGSPLPAVEEITRVVVREGLTVLPPARGGG